MSDSDILDVLEKKRILRIAQNDHLKNDYRSGKFKCDYFRRKYSKIGNSMVKN